MQENKIVSREAAHQLGQQRYFTGERCRNGHLAERYVSNGACTGCIVKKFRRRLNPYSHDLVPYHAEQLWLPRQLSILQQAKLEVYLQSCILEYTRALGLLDNDLKEGLAMQIEIMQRELTGAKP